jgi:heme/copper-type cytochrome/quinol oxidase subunit 4
MDMAIKLYRTHSLVRIDAHTVQCKTGGNTFIPIPYGTGSNYAGMLSVDLPDNVKKGQHFTIVVNQVTNISQAVLTHAVAAPALQGRRILGSFQLSIPVTVKENMLVHEVRLLANLRWIQRSIPASNRWYPVFNRYVKQIADRVDALGGNAGDIAASPNDGYLPGSKSSNSCLLLSILILLLLAVLIIVSGATTGTIRTILVSAIAAILLGLGYYWIKTCSPSICRRLKTIFFGVGAGTVVLALLWLTGTGSPQMEGVLITGGAVTVITGLICWVRGCFRR